MKASVDEGTPGNEVELRELYAHRMPEYGYRVVHSQTTFPDWQLVDEGGNPVRAEVEYQSSGFAEHGHDAGACDLIVCWNHDWKCPGVRVLEMSSGHLFEVAQPNDKETGVFLLNYHLIFCPKRRRSVLKGAVKKRLEEVIHQVASDIDTEVLALQIMPDHVHLFVSAIPQMAPNQIAGRFKGASSRILRQEFPHLLRLPSLWTRSSFISTAGNVSSGTIQKYIETQSKR